MNADITIRPFAAQDHDQWLVLWDMNNQGQRKEDVTRQTWNRLLDETLPVHGLGVFVDETLAGLVHFILHPTTGNIAPVCYMQDVFVDPEFRRQGFGKVLVSSVAQRGQQEGWARMYWLAESDNAAAQNLYKTLGVKLDFTLHVLPLTSVSS